MNNLELLLNTMLFRRGSKDKIEHILELFQERHLDQNAIIFSQNMPAEALYIIKSGKVRISMMAGEGEGEGEEMGLLLLGPGEFFGELALIQEANHLVTARAESPVELLLLTRKDFQTLIELEPRIAAGALVVITKLLAMRIRTYHESLKQLIAS
jgi:CRP/FNR family cyclic AMP-dependent transcriptional regulator